VKLTSLCDIFFISLSHEFNVAVTFSIGITRLNKTSSFNTTTSHVEWTVEMYNLFEARVPKAHRVY